MKTTNSKFTKVLALLLSLVTLVSALSITTQAATAKWPASSGIKTYCVSTGNNTTVYQTATSTAKYGTIYASDLVTILGWSGNRIKVSYPTSRGAKVGYVDKSAITPGTINHATNVLTATSGMTAYRRYTGGSTVGSVSRNDRIWIVATKGSRTQLIYPIQGGYKLGWVNTNELPSSTPAPTPSGSAKWEFPMRGAYCTWSSYSNMSWASYNNNSGERDYHLGIDIWGSSSKVYAAASGTVVAYSSSASGTNGRYVIIKHNLNGKTVYSFYAHLASVNVYNGQTVNTNTCIGNAGGSGYGYNNYYGRHLHFAIVDTLWSNGTYWGYSTKFSGNKRNYGGVTFYNPVYVINYDKLP